MSDFVLDCSVTMAWCFEDEACEAGDRALEALRSGASAVVPGLWLIEVANVLLMAERRGRITSDHAAMFVDLLGRLPIVIWKDGQSLSDILDIGRPNFLTAYNAAYVAVAKATGYPLATFDKEILAVLAVHGIDRFP